MHGLNGCDLGPKNYPIFIERTTIQHEEPTNHRSKKNPLYFQGKSLPTAANYNGKWIFFYFSRRAHNR